jgi:hypothetical protein
VTSTTFVGALTGAATTAGTVTTAAQPNITSVGTLSSLAVTGNITGGSLLINGNAVITGNLRVDGTETIFNVQTLSINDKDIIVANNVSDGANVNGAGIQAGNPGVATWFFNNATTSWQSNIGITPSANGTLSLGGASNYWGTAYLASASVAGNITGGNIIANGRPLTSLNASNIDTGTLAQARLANASITLGSTALTLGSTVTTVAGLSSVTSTTFVGALTGAATTAGTVTTAAQPNITSVGTLSSLSVTANVTGGNLVTAGQVSATGNISGNYFVGNGSQLTGIAAGDTIGGNITILTRDSGNVNFAVTAGYVSILTRASGNVSFPLAA